MTMSLPVRALTLATLATLALAVAACGGRKIHGLETGLETGLEPASANSTANSTAPMSPRGLFGKDVWGCIESIREHTDKFFDKHSCMYGLNCGHGCDSGGRAWDGDELDQACWHHKECVRVAGDDHTARCVCHDRLFTLAVSVGEDEGCSWWEFWCKPSDKVTAAPAVAASLSLQISFENCGTVDVDVDVDVSATASATAVATGTSATATATAVATAVSS